MSQEAILRDVSEMTSTVKSFLFEADNDLSYKPGQHVVFSLDIDGEAVKRPYTMTNRPNKNFFTVAVRRYDDGTGSVHMHDLSIGDTVEISEPKGNLYLRSMDHDTVFISTGSGATPMIAMLKEYLERGSGYAYYLHGEKTHASRLFTETLMMLEAEHDNLTVAHSLSDEDWSGRTGFVQRHVPDVVDDYEDAHHYVCGVPAMVVDTESYLVDHGVAESNIFAEGWEDDAA